MNVVLLNIILYIMQKFPISFLAIVGNNSILYQTKNALMKFSVRILLSFGNENAFYKKKQLIFYYLVISSQYKNLPSLQCILKCRRWRK